MNSKHVQPLQPVYSIPVVLNNGNTLSLESYKGKKLLFVNTASDCGYTPQYNELQELYKRFSNNLLIIGFPANDFGEQEQGNNEAIAQFCQINYNITFPLAEKSTVIKAAGQNKIYQWLTDKNKNGWNDTPPSWNFSKYLVNEQGILTHYFDPGVSPNSEDIIKAIETSF